MLDENLFDNGKDITLNNSPRWKRKQKQQSCNGVGDRFIPNRSNQDLEICQLKLKNNENNENINEYHNTLENRLFSTKVKDYKILSLSEKPQIFKGLQNNLRVVYSQNKIFSSKDSLPKNRVISQTPERILDAPSLVDDFYLNLLDWSSENILAVALSDSVYLWNAANGVIQKLMTTSEPDDFVTSISWIEDGSYLGIGTNHNEVLIYDVEKQKKVRTMDGHTGRVSSLSWNAHILSSGSRDTNVINHDVRIQQHLVSTLRGHEQEVCGLKWSLDGNYLASGGNDNILNVWDGQKISSSSVEPRHTFNQHIAAVKAIAWCPWQNGLLASGGGTADKQIKFWNVYSGQCLQSVDTGSQVCSIVWSKFDKELVSSHGFTKNQLTVWRYPSMVKIAELTGHTSRVLHMAQSPDGTTICSAAGDETLRFWKVFDPPNNKTQTDISPMSIKGMNIR